MYDTWVTLAQRNEEEPEEILKELRHDLDMLDTYMYFATQKLFFLHYDPPRPPILWHYRSSDIQGTYYNTQKLVLHIYHASNKLQSIALKH